MERRKKGGARVKKSVSFSSDTSFEEKREPYKRAAIHEAKVYHKGVLQGTRLSLPSLRPIHFIFLEFVCIRPVRLSDFPIFSRYVQSSKLVRRNHRCFLWEFVKKNAHTRAIHWINERRKQKRRQYDAMKNTPDIRRIIDLLSELYLLCKWLC